MVVVPRPRRKRIVTAAVYTLAIVGALIGLVTFLDNHTSQTSACSTLRHTTTKLPFPIYCPRSLPSYFFIDADGLRIGGNMLIFAIVRSDGQKILVTEQALPSGFTLDGIDGLDHEIVGVGRVVIGNGFTGKRAVLQTKSTLVFLSAPGTIGGGDLEAITYSFRPL